MRAAKLENNIVENLIEAEQDYINEHANVILVPDGTEVSMGYVYENGTFKHPKGPNGKQRERDQTWKWVNGQWERNVPLLKNNLKESAESIRVSLVSKKTILTISDGNKTIPVNPTTDVIARITGKIEQITGTGKTISFRDVNRNVVFVDENELRKALEAVNHYYDWCDDRKEAIVDEVEATNDYTVLDAIDIESKWPVNQYMLDDMMNRGESAVSNGVVTLGVKGL